MGEERKKKEHEEARELEELDRLDREKRNNRNNFGRRNNGMPQDPRRNNGMPQDPRRFNNDSPRDPRRGDPTRREENTPDEDGFRTATRKGRLKFTNSKKVNNEPPVREPVREPMSIRREE